MRTYEEWLDEKVELARIKPDVKHREYMSPTCSPYTKYVYNALMVEIEALKAELAKRK